MGYCICLSYHWFPLSMDNNLADSFVILPQQDLQTTSVIEHRTHWITRGLHFPQCLLEKTELFCMGVVLFGQCRLSPVRNCCRFWQMNKHTGMKHCVTIRDLCFFLMLFLSSELFLSKECIFTTFSTVMNHNNPNYATKIYNLHNKYVFPLICNKTLMTIYTSLQTLF